MKNPFLFFPTVGNRARTTSGKEERKRGRKETTPFSGSAIPCFSHVRILIVLLLLLLICFFSLTPLMAFIFLFFFFFVTSLVSAQVFLLVAPPSNSLGFKVLTVFNFLVTSLYKTLIQESMCNIFANCSSPTIENWI